MPVEIINGVRVNSRDVGRYPGTTARHKAQLAPKSGSAADQSDADKEADLEALAEALDKARNEGRQEGRAAVLAELDDDTVPPEVAEAVKAVIERDGDTIAEAAARFAEALAATGKQPDAEAKPEPAAPTKAPAKKAAAKPAARGRK